MIPAHLRLPGDGYSGSGVTLPEGVSLATTLFFADHPQLDEKVIMLGEGEVGKTSLWNCLREGGKPMELGKHVTTIGADYWHVNTVLAHIPPVSLKMMFWDTAGQERFNSLVGAYVKQSSVVLLVFDLTARHTFQLLEKHWLPLVKEKAPRAHRIYVGNKSDMSEKRFGTRNEILQELASINDSIADDNYIETSCLAGTNVARLFIRARSLFIENDETARGVLSGDTLIIDRLQKRTQLQAAVVRLDDIAPRRTSSSGRRGGSSSSSRVTPAWPPNNNNNNTKNAQNAPCNC